MDEREFIQRAEQTLREIWVAAKSGGYHFRHDGARWVHTRDGGELFGALSDCASQLRGRRWIRERVTPKMRQQGEGPFLPMLA